ncbi:MAG TPA: DUF58 domain-containing protein [Polyangiaceae bacterium]|jgi:uncharacterized protein (DUF58 family)|nr:DUF58 domain-containing protein [Polyangiaceae bacterium]
MGILELFQRKKPARGAARRAPLFDDEFQRKLEMLALVSRKVFAGRLRAERRSKKKGSGVEFADHRDYVAGDDIRSIDWNVYRRFGRLLVRLYEEEEDLSIYFLLDCSASMGFGDGQKFDQARRLVAALAYVGLANLDRVTIVGVTDGVPERLPTTRGKGRIFTVFRFLEKLTPRGHTDLAEALRAFAAQHKRRGLAVLVSDFYDPAGFEQGINVLRFEGFEPYVIHLVDSREATPPLDGDLLVVDCETGDEREVTVTPAVLDRLKAAFADYSTRLEHFCTNKRVPYLAADAAKPFDEIVLRALRRGGFLK